MMLYYPVFYVVCTLPLAGARMASMTGSIVVPYCWVSHFPDVATNY
jgi:hypothetical protein